MRHHHRASAVLLLCLGILLSVAGCAPAAPALKAHVAVPGDAATITEAAALVAPGGVIEVAAGVYAEEVVISTPDVTLRGIDRNATVIDGEGRRPYGIVAIADGVRIENLTVTRATFYGVLVSGLHDGGAPAPPTGDSYSGWDPDAFPPLERFLVDHVTAINNGLYGIYAFNSRHGIIRDSYASGSADSGIYVGQCEECDVLVTGNVAERNAVGFENANASDSVVVVGNRFSHNRIGMTFLSSYQEAFTPQRGNTVVGNVIIDNASADSPAHAEGGFGIGIGISGGQGNVFERNLLSGHPRADVVLAHTENIPTRDNRFTSNVSTSSVSVANASAARTPATGNCWQGASPTTTSPATLASDLDRGCTGSTAAQPAESPAVTISAPAGMSFLRVPPPHPQPQLGGSPASAPLPPRVAMPDVADIPTPDVALLSANAGQS